MKLFKAQIARLFAAILLVFPATSGLASDASLAVASAFKNAMDDVHGGSDRSAIDSLMARYFDSAAYLNSHWLTRTKLTEVNFDNLRAPATRFATDMILGSEPGLVEGFSRLDLTAKMPEEAKTYCIALDVELSISVANATLERRDLLGARIALMKDNLQYLKNQRDALTGKNADVSWLLREGADGIWSRLAAATEAELKNVDRKRLLQDIDRKIASLEKEHATVKAQKDPKHPCRPVAYVFGDNAKQSISLVITVVEKGSYLKVMNVENFALGVSTAGIRVRVNRILPKGHDVSPGDLERIKALLSIAHYK